MSKMLPLRLVLLAAPLAGCLEVEQYPRYSGGQYDGKPDQLPATAHFHGDRLAWNAVLTDRNHQQNEYERTQPPSAEGHGPAERGSTAERAAPAQQAARGVAGAQTEPQSGGSPAQQPQAPAREAPAAKAQAPAGAASSNAHDARGTSQ